MIDSCTYTNGIYIQVSVRDITLECLQITPTKFRGSKLPGNMHNYIWCPYYLPSFMKLCLVVSEELRWQTVWWTDGQDKNNMSPHQSGGDIIYQYMYTIYPSSIIIYQYMYTIYPYSIIIYQYMYTIYPSSIIIYQYMYTMYPSSIIIYQYMYTIYPSSIIIYQYMHTIYPYFIIIYQYMYTIYPSSIIIYQYRYTIYPSSIIIYQYMYTILLTFNYNSKSILPWLLWLVVTLELSILKISNNPYSDSLMCCDGATGMI